MPASEAIFPAGIHSRASRASRDLREDPCTLAHLRISNSRLGIPESFRSGIRNIESGIPLLVVAERRLRSQTDGSRRHCQPRFCGLTGRGSPAQSEILGLVHPAPSSCTPTGCRSLLRSFRPSGMGLACRGARDSLGALLLRPLSNAARNLTEHIAKKFASYSAIFFPHRGF